MKTVFTYGGSNPYAPKLPALITLQQFEQDPERFTLTYGIMVTEHMTYTDAAHKLGEAILHHLAFESVLVGGAE